MSESRRTILSYLKNKNSPYGPYTWQSVNGEVKVQWLPDEGKGWIDIENPKGVKGASGFRKLMRSVLPKLDIIAAIPAQWEWNPDDVKKGGIYEYLGPKMKGSFTPNPNMPNKAAVWDTRPKSKGTIMSVKKNVPKNTDPWTVKNDIYILTDDSSENRRLLENHLTTKIKEGYKPKGILYGKDKTPHRLSTKSIERVLDPNDTLDKVNIKKSNTGKPSPRTYWGKSQASMEDQIKYTKRVRDDLVNKFIEGSKIKPVTKMHGHHVRMLQMYSPFFENLNDVDIAELAKFAAKRFPLGDVKANIALLDEDFHNQLHNFMREKGYQLRSGVAKGTPDLGDTLESRKAALTHFFDNVQEPIEQELSRVRWDQQAKYNPLSDEEVLNQLNWMNDNEFAAEIKAAKRRGEITEVGRRLGGPGDIIRGTFRKLRLSKPYSNTQELIEPVVKTLKPIAKVAKPIAKLSVAGKVVFGGLDAKAAVTGAGEALDEEAGVVEKTAGILESISGATGVASLFPGPQALVTAPVSVVTGLGSAALRYKEDIPEGYELKPGSKGMYSRVLPTRFKLTDKNFNTETNVNQPKEEEVQSSDPIK